MSFSQLNDELIREILIHSSVQIVAKFCGTCSKVRNICNDGYFWQLKHKHDFPTRRNMENWKESYIDWFRVEKSGLFTNVVVLTGEMSASLFKSPVFPIEINITYTLDGDEHSSLSSNVSVYPNIDDTYYTDVPKGLYDVQERERGDPYMIRSKTVTKEEAAKIIEDKLKDGYIAYNNYETDFQGKIKKIRELGLTSAVKMFDFDTKWSE